MATNKNDIIEAVSSLSVLESNELVKALEEKFGASPASVSVLGSGSTDISAKLFEVFFTSVSANDISTIKTVREITGLGLKEAKDLVAKAAYAPEKIKEAVSILDATMIKRKLEEVRATAEIK